MKKVIITGGATGIGRECARFFSKKGWLTVVFYNSSEDAAKELRKEALANECMLDTIKCDVTKESSVKNAFSEVVKRYGPADVLINNAGVSLIKEFTKLTEEDWDRVMGVNLKGAFLCAREAVLGMQKKGAGRIINVSSMWGLCGASFETAYSAAKAGLIGFTKALAKEIAGSGITVNAVAPGFIDTQMNACVCEEVKTDYKSRTPAGRLGTAQEIASIIYYLADSAPDFITGEVINASGGLLT